MVKDDGRKNKARAIASDLNISDNYVYHMQRQLRFKFCVSDNIQLVVRAIQMGVISADGTVVKRNSKSSHNSAETVFSNSIDQKVTRVHTSMAFSGRYLVSFNAAIAISMAEGHPALV